MDESGAAGGARGGGGGVRADARRGEDARLAGVSDAAERGGCVELYRNDKYAHFLYSVRSGRLQRRVECSGWAGKSRLTKKGGVGRLNPAPCALRRVGALDFRLRIAAARHLSQRAIFRLALSATGADRAQMARPASVLSANAGTASARSQKPRW